VPPESAQEKLLPMATCVTFDRPTTSTGVVLDVFVPLPS
jgi:hypothetical protein